MLVVMCDYLCHLLQDEHFPLFFGYLCSLSLKESLVKQLRIAFKRLKLESDSVCVANFTNKQMVLNVVLVIKLYLGCELI